MLSRADPMLALNAADGEALAIAGLVIPGIVLTVLSRTLLSAMRFSKLTSINRQLRLYRNS